MPDYFWPFTVTSWSQTTKTLEVTVLNLIWQKHFSIEPVFSCFFISSLCAELSYFPLALDSWFSFSLNPVDFIGQALHLLMRSYAFSLRVVFIYLT